jgi:hypothetical protein
MTGVLYTLYIVKDLHLVVKLPLSAHGYIRTRKLTYYLVGNNNASAIIGTKKPFITDHFIRAVEYSHPEGSEYIYLKFQEHSSHYSVHIYIYEILKTFFLTRVTLIHEILRIFFITRVTLAGMEISHKTWRSF